MAAVSAARKRPRLLSSRAQTSPDTPSRRSQRPPPATALGASIWGPLVCLWPAGPGTGPSLPVVTRQAEPRRGHGPGPTQTAEVRPHGPGLGQCRCRLPPGVVPARWLARPRGLQPGRGSCVKGDRPRTGASLAHGPRAHRAVCLPLPGRPSTAPWTRAPRPRAGRRPPIPTQCWACTTPRTTFLSGRQVGGRGLRGRGGVGQGFCACTAATSRPQEGPRSS